MKKILTLICTLLCANVLMAQTRFIVGELQYEVTGANKVEVHDCMPSATSIVIPDTVTYQETNYCVATIGSVAFQNCHGLISVYIPNSITHIGEEAFNNCTNLTSIDIPNSVTNIEGRAFVGCHSLTSIFFGNGITSIKWQTFEGCSSLTSITFGNSLTSIEWGAFENCSSLTSIIIPNTVTSIGEGAFQGCSSLTSITLPNNDFADIHNRAFNEAGRFMVIDSVTYLAESNVRVGYNNFNVGFAVFYKGDSVYFPTTSSVKVEKCDRNKNGILEIPSAIELNNYSFPIKIIGNEAFSNCHNLTSITIPDGIETIEAYSFYLCSSLTSLTILANNPPNCHNIACAFSGVLSNIFVPCGRVETYSNSEWGTRFSNQIFELNREVEISLNNSDLGSVEVESVCVEATLTATANEGYAFLSWNDGNTDNPRIVALSSDTMFTAYFGNTLIYDTICQGTTYEENNFNQTEQGFYSQTFTDINSQDSVVVLSLNVLPTFNTELTASICEGESYTENGFNVSEEGTYTQTLQAINGCDSIVTLTLNVNPIFNTELTATICEGQVYTENNFNISEAGVYTQTLTSANGCDSIVTLTLNVNPIFNTELSANICQGQVYNENGFNVSEAGVYTQNLQTVNGCDSIVTLTLNVNPIYNTELTATICQGQTYTENGFNVNEAGIYTQTLQTINGCDSIVTLTLNVNPIYNTELTATICEGQVYTENNFNVSEAGVYTQTLQTVNGCDSIVTLTLNVNPVYNTELTATICEGQIYTENNFNVSEAGVYTQTLTSVNGCDSIVTLTLNVNPIFNTELTSTICEGSVYTENNFNVSEAGVYTQTLTSVNGCDSIVTLTLNVNPIYNTELTATICEGSVYTENNFNVNEAGVYTQTLTSVNGCDSIVTLTLNVNPIYNTELS